MRLEELELPVPEELIAQAPVEPRDSCRLLYLPTRGPVRHLVFRELPALLEPGDCLVFNDSRVLPARVTARKSTGGRVELLFLKRLDTARAGERERWEVLARPSHRLRAGQELVLAGGEKLSLETAVGEGRWLVAMPAGQSGLSLLDAYGEMPLPPYIRRKPKDPSEYQTVYARHPGSAAAPTAGLHFTEELLKRLESRGVRRAFVTLHVGLDTFQPIREAVVEEHVIHTEDFHVTADALRVIRETRARGGRVVAVGTTSVRVLETLAAEGRLDASPGLDDVQGTTGIFITPGYHFRAVDVLITNFHLPRSTVLALTMAFAGVERLRAAYAEAVALRYRFFSWGDAMLIEPPEADPGEVGRA